MVGLSDRDFARAFDVRGPHRWTAGCAGGYDLGAVPVLDEGLASESAPRTVTAAMSDAPATGDTVDLHALAGLVGWTRATHGDAAVRDVCAAAGIAPDAFTNGGEQLALPQLATFLTALRDRIGGDGAFLAAATSGEIRANALPRWVRWLATPGLLYRGPTRRAWVTHQRGLGALSLRYTSTAPQSRCMCLWRQARLAQQPRAWKLPPAVVHETRCLARGDDACDYVVHWQPSPRWTPAIVAATAAAAGLAWSAIDTGIAWCLPVLLAVAAHAIENERVRRARHATATAFAIAFRRAAAATPAQRPSAGTTDATAPLPTPAGDEPASIRREADFWRVAYEGKTILVRHSRGLSLLLHLLRNPGEEIHVSALDALIPSDAAVPAYAAGVAGGVPVTDLGDAGEVLDAQAKATYRRHVNELREELADAEACNDLGRLERLRMEMDAVIEQLQQATGLGGRSRRVASNTDRVRVAVTRRIRAAIAQIEKHHAPLGEHLTATIRTGYFCSYGPGGIRWQE